MNQRLMILALVALCVLLIASPSQAYRLYSDSNGENNCVTCHGGFRDGNPSLHQIHVGSSQMTQNCDLCHYGAGNSSFKGVRIKESGESNEFSCTGCHIPGGLIVKHNSSTCNGCHPGATAGLESDFPNWYGRDDVNLVNPCRIGRNNGGEDYTGDGLGLDNDGDGDYDLDDADCAGVPTEVNTWGAYKAIYSGE